jgi:Xaa-Pro aminopeptidase
LEFFDDLTLRKKRLAKFLRRNQLEAAVFLKEEIEAVNGDFVYFGGGVTSGEYAAIVVDPEENSYAIVHEYSFERAAESGLYDQVYEIRQSIDQLVLALRRLMKEKLPGKKGFAFDFATISANTLDLIQGKIPGVKNSGLTEFVFSQRSLKSRFELDEMERAVGIAKSCFERTIESLKEGQRLADISKLLSKNLIEENTLPSFEIDVRLRRDMKEKEVEKLRKGDLVLFDFGARLPSMYLSDVGRTIPFQRASSATRDFMSDVVSIKKEGIKRIRSGTNGNNTRADIDRLIEEHGYVSTHRPGHQIGINVHEPYGPHLAFGSENAGRLKEGNVVTWEPGIGFKETQGPKNRFGMAHMEDMVLVGKDSRALGDFDLEYW